MLAPSDAENTQQLMVVPKRRTLVFISANLKHELKDRIGRTRRFQQKAVQCLVARRMFGESDSFCSRKFNLRTDGFATTSHAARKWLRGEAIPTQDKLVVLSRWLILSPQWLRYGEECATGNDHAANDPKGLPRDDLALLNNMHLLDERSREIVKDLVAFLLRITRRGRKRTTRNKSERGAASGGRDLNIANPMDQC